MEWLERIAVSGRQLLFALLRGAGPIPRHIAIIMDGNRRYANQNNIERYLGHERGCDKVERTFSFEKIYMAQFIEVVKWCLELGASYISVYAFSIENFKRSEEEVEELMQLAKKEYKLFAVPLFTSIFF